jgi:hypothetical protein
MKYSDLFTLNPIESVIQIDKAEKKNEAQRLVERFVITPSLGEAIESVALPQLDFESGAEGKGIFVVGNYGTGKSHVMSFLSVLAEDAGMLQYVQNEGWKARLGLFAGKYKARRCEIGGSMMNLYQIVAEQLQVLAKSCGFTFTFKTQSEISNVKTEFARFMEAFDAVCPGKGVLLIIDEMLHFLQSRPTDNEFILDLSVLQMLGEFSNGSRFVFMAGVQQSLFNNPRFNHVAQDINRVKQRYYDFVIDSKGVAQLIEQYLFQKDAAQKAQIRDLLAKQANLYDMGATEIDQCVALFPAHPRFIAEFQNVFVVERREILTVLTKEARALADQTWNEDNPALITSDRYWKHVEADQGLTANNAIKQVKQNVTTLKARIQTEFGTAEDKPGAERLVEALAVNRLTTPSITDTVGLTPADLKNNLLWKTKLPMQDSRLLTAAVKRLLDNTRKAANGQFIAVSETTGQYYIDPMRVVDYDQDVTTAAGTLNKDVVQRYLNEIVTRAMELDNASAVKEGRLWEYGLVWTERNVERPGWLCFNFPNQRSTAKPPKDFYLFLIPSKRVTGLDDSIPNNPDETYWFFEDFPRAKCDLVNPLGESEPDSFLDTLRKYAAARERSIQSGNNLQERTAFDSIAKRHLGTLMPEFNDNAGDWITVLWNGQRKRFREWVAELDPARANAPFKSKMDAISQVMFAPFFASKYRNYPTFSVQIREATRRQAAQNALEVLCETAFAENANGKAVLTALGLYKDGAFVPDQSPWLAKVRNRLKLLTAGQFLNQSELFERVDERTWFKGEDIEAEWLQVVLTAGVKSGDLVISGQNNKRYDASNLKECYNDVKSYEGIIRVSRPSELPIDLWKPLFKLFGVNVGLLANNNTLDEAIKQFNTKVQGRITDIVEWEQEIKAKLPFATQDTQTVIAQHADAFRGAKYAMETWLFPINTRAKMQNLKLDGGGITALQDQWAMCVALANLLAFVKDNQTGLSATERFDAILGSLDADFCTRLGQLEANLNAMYAQPQTLETAKDNLKAELNATVSAALKTYHTLHKRYRLDKAGDTRKKAIVNSPTLKQLNRLVNIKTLTAAKLEEIRRRLDILPCNGCSDAELLKNSLSLCPNCNFNPGNFAGQDAALEVLTLCEQDVEQLHKAWTGELLNDLQDPFVLASLNALKPEERKLVDSFIAAQSLPADISDPFINAINTVLSGLKRKTVKAQEFARQVVGDGTPLKPAEVREKFEAWLKAQIGTDDQNTVRLVLEE